MIRRTLNPGAFDELEINVNGAIYHLCFYPEWIGRDRKGGGEGSRGVVQGETGQRGRRLAVVWSEASGNEEIVKCDDSKKLKSFHMKLKM